MLKKAKVIFLGDTAVGKSSIISAVHYHPINLTHEPTVGMDFSTTILEDENSRYKLQLWDTAGQEKFRSIMPSYIRNSKIAIIVYDVTCLKSFLNLEKWIALYEDSCQKDSGLVIVGNKIDLYHDRHVSMDRVQKNIVSKKYSYCQISAKTREGVNQLLDILLEKLNRMNLEYNEERTFKRLSEQKQGENKNCCGWSKPQPQGIKVNKNQQYKKVVQKSTKSVEYKKQQPPTIPSTISIEQMCEN